MFQQEEFAQSRISNFSFYEVGTNYGDKGIHPMNKLFLEEDNTLRGTSKYKPSHKYIVSQVRKN
ncbi:hypothetical protein [Tenacibaculum maritimum]|uniref:hypothetical protein n=1 Tax=Tenacibaculum maritimum TaxID=107401 RepID=UPI001E3E696D|nr:hypothetical protein [Tenacibaculum maritimum]MCD9580375.1 hypothetical protein [Tenacibaculum maritimum]